MSNTESQEKVIPVRTKTFLTLKMPLSMPRPGMKDSLSTLSNQGEIIPATEGDEESPKFQYLGIPRKKRKIQQQLRRYASR